MIVEVVLKWGKCVGMRRGVGMWGSQHTLLHLSPHPPHSPDTSSHTQPTPPPRIPTLTQHVFPHFPILNSHFPTLSHTSPHPSHLSFIYLNTFPHSLPILPHNPHASSNTSLCSPYIIIHPMPKFLTFLIYCQISVTIKYTRNFLSISYKIFKAKIKNDNTISKL